MFRRLVIAFITAVAAFLETAADAIAATLPLPPWTVPSCGWSRPGGYASSCPSSRAPSRSRSIARNSASFRPSSLAMLFRAKANKALPAGAACAASVPVM